MAVAIYFVVQRPYASTLLFIEPGPKLSNSSIIEIPVRTCPPTQKPFITVEHLRGTHKKQGQLGITPEPNISTSQEIREPSDIPFQLTCPPDIARKEAEERMGEEVRGRPSAGCRTHTVSNSVRDTDSGERRAARTGCEIRV